HDVMAPLDANGVAHHDTVSGFGGLGNLLFVATYAGDSNFGGSHTSPTLGVDKYRSKTALGSSINPSPEGQDVTFTPTVAPFLTDPGIPPTGMVEFRDSATSLGMVSLDAAGAALFTTNTLSVGDHDITAHYAGDSSYGPSETLLSLHQVVLPDRDHD